MTVPALETSDLQCMPARVQVVATLSIPLHELVAAWPPDALAAEVEAVAGLVHGAHAISSRPTQDIKPSVQHSVQPAAQVQPRPRPTLGFSGGFDSEGSWIEPGDTSGHLHGSCVNKAGVRDNAAPAGSSTATAAAVEDDDDEFAWGDVAAKPSATPSCALSAVNTPAAFQPTSTASCPAQPQEQPQHQPQAPPVPLMPPMHALVAATSAALVHGRQHEARLAAAALLTALDPPVRDSMPPDVACKSAAQQHSRLQNQQQGQQPHQSPTQPHCLLSKGHLQDAAAEAGNICKGLSWGREVGVLELLGCDPSAASGVVRGVALPHASRLMPGAAEVAAEVAARVAAAAGGGLGSSAQGERGTTVCTTVILGTSYIRLEVRLGTPCPVELYVSKFLVQR